MGDGLNRAILMGNVGSDPEVRYTASGTPVLSMRVATNESFVDKNKEVQERTEWHNVVVWGARGEALARILTKGTGVLVEGGLRTSSYEKDGVKRYKTEIHARELFITNRRGTPPLLDDDTGPARAPAVHRNGKSGVSAPAPEIEVMEEVAF